jgi:LysM domain
MATIDPAVRGHDVERLLRRSTRVAAVAAYGIAVVLGLIVARPAFNGSRPAPVVERPVQAPVATDAVRKGENAADFAARHGLDLGELLALNPKVDSLFVKPGTRLRVS